MSPSPRFSRRLASALSPWALALAAAGPIADAKAAAGDLLGGEIVVGTDFTQSRVDIARAPGGAFVVTWVALDGGRSTVLARRHAADGSALGDAIVVRDEQTDTQDLSNASVAIDDDGDFVVAWQRSDRRIDLRALRRDSIRAQRFRADGTPDGREITVAADGQAPDVAMDADGDFTVAWSVDGTITQALILRYGLPLFIPNLNGLDAVRARRYAADGRPLTLPLTVATALRRYSPLISVPPTFEAARVASDAAGNFTVAWLRTPSRSDDDPRVEFRRYAATGFASSPTTIQPGSERGDQTAPALAMNARGQTVLAYRSGADGLIRFSSYSPQGTPELIDVAASAGPAPSPDALFMTPAAAIDDDGNVAIAAISFPASVADRQVNLRLFNANGLPSTASAVRVDADVRFGLDRESLAMAVAADGELAVVYSGYRFDPPAEFRINAQRIAGR